MFAAEKILKTPQLDKKRLFYEAPLAQSVKLSQE